MIDMGNQQTEYYLKFMAKAKDVNVQQFNNIFEYRTVLEILWTGYFNELVYAGETFTGEITPAGMFAMFYGVSFIKLT